MPFFSRRSAHLWMRASHRCCRFVSAQGRSSGLAEALQGSALTRAGASGAACGTAASQERPLAARGMRSGSSDVVCPPVPVALRLSPPLLPASLLFCIIQSILDPSTRAQTMSPVQR